MSKKEHFKKVVVQQEKQAVFNKIVAQGIQFSAIIAEAEAVVLNLQAVAIENDYLKCRLITKEVSPNSQGKLTAKLSLGTDLFYFSTQFKFLSEYIFLSTKADVFKMQLRETYRFSMPKEAAATFQIDGSNDIYQVVDISGGGCHIVSSKNPKLIENGEVIRGKIHIRDSGAIAVNMQVRHIKADANIVTLGCEFMNLAAQDESRLASVIMDFYKEMWLPSKAR